MEVIAGAAEEVAASLLSSDLTAAFLSGTLHLGRAPLATSRAQQQEGHWHLDSLLCCSPPA